MRSTTVTAGLGLALFLVGMTAYAGAPLKGVDVKLGRSPGGSAATRTTNDEGAFDFGVVPRGTYALTIAEHSEKPSARAAREHAAARAEQQQACEVEIRGGTGGTIRAGWDFKQGRRFDPATESHARAASEDRILVLSDGKHPIQGAVVRSKSNISNN